MEPSSIAPRAYRFGVFELDVGSAELRRRGLKVRLRGRPIDILLLLLARRGELVTRDELRTALWNADTFVDFDHGLNSAMNKLRDALGDAAERSRYIETVPRRGYRFVAPVEVLGEPAVLANTVSSPSGAVVPVQTEALWPGASGPEGRSASPSPQPDLPVPVTLVGTRPVASSHRRRSPFILLLAATLVVAAG